MLQSTDMANNDAVREDQVKSVSSDQGELARSGVNATLADLHALTFTETSRTPYDGDESRSQGKFPTRNGGKRS